MWQNKYNVKTKSIFTIRSERATVLARKYREKNTHCYNVGFLYVECRYEWQMQCRRKQSQWMYTANIYRFSRKRARNLNSIPK